MQAITWALSIADVLGPRVQLDSHVQAVSYIHDPNVLFLLFAVATIGIALEIAHPGARFPAVVGVIAFAAFLIGVAPLDPNWLGFALMMSAMALLIIGVRIPAHGVITLGALVTLVVGSLIFFDTGTDQSVSTVNTYMVLSVAVGMGLVALVLIRYALMARHGLRISGAEGLVGQTGFVTTPLRPGGRIKVLGEDWAAELSPAVAVFAITMEAGRQVRVTGFEGLQLIVEPVEPIHNDILGLLLTQPEATSEGEREQAAQD
jgi:membrane-bound serine protease (ClpP class)